MTVCNYQKGDKPRCIGTFTDSDGNLADPDVVLFRTLDPAGTLSAVLTYGVDADLVRDSAGVYHVDVDANQSGTWSYRFYSTGGGQAAGEGSFQVDVSKF